MNDPVVSVLVPTHEDAALLELALPVFRQEGSRVEVIVVNNDPMQSDTVRDVVSSAHPEAIPTRLQ
jgi:hypothetical protein